MDPSFSSCIVKFNSFSYSFLLFFKKYFSFHTWCFLFSSKSWMPIYLTYLLNLLITKSMKFCSDYQINNFLGYKNKGLIFWKDNIYVNYQDPWVHKHKVVAKLPHLDCIHGGFLKGISNLLCYRSFLFYFWLDMQIINFHFISCIFISL